MMSSRSTLDVSEKRIRLASVDDLGLNALCNLRILS